MNEQFENCPFCGAVAYQVPGYQNWYIYHGKKCWLFPGGGLQSLFPNCVAWNRRALSPEVKALVEAADTGAVRSAIHNAYTAASKIYNDGDEPNAQIASVVRELVAFQRALAALKER